MILLSSIIKKFEKRFFDRYKIAVLPSHKNALGAMKECRKESGPHMLAQCVNDNCRRQYIPHSCGHRNCPHCQNHESRQWIENQLNKQLPAQYYLITFTLPRQLRKLAWKNQKVIYSLMFQCIQELLKTFTQSEQISIQRRYSRERYLRCENTMVTFRYIHSSTGKYRTRTVSGEYFLWLLMQHILPKGFRKARCYGFLHPCSKKIIKVLQLILKQDLIGRTQFQFGQLKRNNPKTASGPFMVPSI